jgi:hypothetical protein
MAPVSTLRPTWHAADGTVPTCITRLRWPALACSGLVHEFGKTAQFCHSWAHRWAHWHTKDVYYTCAITGLHMLAHEAHFNSAELGTVALDREHQASSDAWQP